MAKVIAFLVLLLISPAAYAATTHTVGGSAGWTTSIGNWASTQTFVVGDSLLFNYDFSHAVDEVSQSDYQSCDSSNPISSDNASPTTIALTTVGTRYFICPRSNHCSQGMKLAVTVTAGTTSPTPPTGGTTPSPPSGSPPATPATPGTPATPATPGTPSSRNAPPPPSGGGAATLGSGSTLVVGLSIVLGAVMGLMG